jgi:hypothetical protein
MKFSVRNRLLSYLFFDFPFGFALVLLGYAFQIHMDAKPRHVQRWLGNVKVSDYWTTNRCEISPQATNTLTPEGYKTEIVWTTNRLW